MQNCQSNLDESPVRPIRLLTLRDVASDDVLKSGLSAVRLAPAAPRSGLFNGRDSNHGLVTPGELPVPL